MLEQVAGRAAGGVKPGKVIIQSYWSTHPAIVSVLHMTDARFLMQNLKRVLIRPLSNVLWESKKFVVQRIGWQRRWYTKLDAQRMGDFGPLIV